MKSVVILVACLTVASCAWAVDLGPTAPAKPAGTVTAPPPDPAVIRQGGDTFAEAVPIPIPTVDLAGTTEGYTHDYDEGCPQTWTESPDVVYSIVPEADMVLDIDLCGSAYDTKVYVYDEDLVRIACNDDFYNGPPCGAYRSKIENMAVAAGVLYYIVIDGYGGDFGEYLIDVIEDVPCEMECPTGAVFEGEPPLADDYIDLHNGGCNTDVADPPFQPLTAGVFCGTSGFYTNDGSESRDTDWFTATIPAGGTLEITGDAELACYMFELGPQDCGEVAVVQSLVVGPCLANTMIITGDAGDLVWFWVGPTVFSSPEGSPFEFDYVLTTNLDPVATEAHSWSAVKELFD